MTAVEVVMPGRAKPGIGVAGLGGGKGGLSGVSEGVGWLESSLLV